MKKKSIIKMIIDIAMLVIMLLEYSKVYTGQFMHEIFGIILFILFTSHNILNINFYKGLMKGKYTIRRSITVFSDIVFLICMLMTIILGIPISREVFKNLNLNGNMTIRKLHTIFGYWGLIFLSFHIGLHLKMIISKVKSKLKENKNVRYVALIVELLIIVIGIKFTLDINLLDHLIGKSSFASNEGNIFMQLIKNFIIILSISCTVYNLDGIRKKQDKRRINKEDQ